ncbi:adenine phosphoribosyltransferase [Glaciihabitans sp. INWT7]|uniref:adenine phosphoribosyltransferase n=1 Tax=Glaciihabitans sp. INWT7 TaxID=2596912 RepID=UPI001626EF52|nr:adenine phosphoribosyltransferase [Glaciihabitans sp. INWT7]QNE47601.1 adenine phosphoribosyltransferase [Glaciihabitans sp. INWT7]
MSQDAREAIERLSRKVVDFPSPGIVFRDLSPVFADGPAYTSVIDALLAPFAGKFDALAGMEARGFVLAAGAAYATGLGCVMIRKPGKLPRAVITEEYTLEYGTGTLEVHPDELEPGTRVLLLDDVLATGGTLAASCRLVERAGWRVAGISVVLELGELHGTDKLPDRRVNSLLTI